MADLLVRHNQVVRTQLDCFRGREVATTGDGFVAIFDGAERAIRAAHEIIRGLETVGLPARAGSTPARSSSTATTSAV